VSRSFKKIPPTDAVGISSSLVDTATAAGRLPPHAGILAKAVAPVLPDLIRAARKSQETLVDSLANRDGKVIHRGSEVEDARKVERELDRLVSALSARLGGLEKEGAEGAKTLSDFLFAESVRELTRLTGRPQRARYVQWVRTWPARPAQGSAADLDVAASLARIEAEVMRFGKILDGKDHTSRGATGAIDEAGDAFRAWVDAIGELVLAMEVVLQSDEDAFENWLSPYSEWRRAQARAQGETGEITLSEENGSVPGPTPAPEPPLSSGPQ
jgi:hypothetical protein